jgi:hypothetical protein
MIAAGKMCAGGLPHTHRHLCGHRTLIGAAPDAIGAKEFAPHCRVVSDVLTVSIPAVLVPWLLREGKGRKPSIAVRPSRMHRQLRYLQDKV